MATDDKKHNGTLYFYFANKLKFISFKFAGPAIVIVIREVARWEIFMEQEWDLGWIWAGSATFENIFGLEWS